MQHIAVALVRLYRLTLSPYWPGRCRYLPSCSHYAEEALRRFGFWKGSWLALRRLARCYPWGGLGYDPVPSPEDSLPCERAQPPAQPSATWSRHGVLLVLVAGILVLLGACVPGGPGIRPGWAGVAAAQATVYVGSQSGRVLALDRDTGVARGSFPPEGSDPLPGLYSGPLVVGDLVLVGGYNGKLYALNARDLSERWRYPVDASDVKPIVGGLTVAGDLLLFGASDGYLRALALASGSEVWKFRAGDKVWSTPTVAGDIVYFGSLDHQLYAVSLADGRPLWTTPFRAGGAMAATPAVAGGKVFVGSFDRNFYAIDAATGKEVWRFPGDNWFWAGAATDGARVYAISMNGTLYALDVATGKLQWEKAVGGPAISPPLLVEGQLMVASDQGLVYVLDPATGASRAPSYNVGAKVRAPLTAHQGIVYINALDHNVWAMRLGGKQEKLWQASTKPKG